MIRDALKSFTKTVGIYSHVRDAKDLAYRTLRDSRWTMPLGFRRLFPSERGRAAELLAEFQSERLWERIIAGIEEQARLDKDFHPSVSSPFNLRALYVLCRLLRPADVVETGVANGASSWVILRALQKNGSGRLHSIDLPPAQWDPARKEYREIDHVSLPVNRRPGWLVPADLRADWELILGDSRKELPALMCRLPGLDLFYHDAEHTREAMLLEFRTVWPKLSSAGALTSDDIGWNSAFDEFAAEIDMSRAAKRWFSFGLIRKNDGR